MLMVKIGWTNLASGISIRLDAAAVLAVNDLGVGEGDAVDGVVALAADGADGETVTTVAVEVVDDDRATAGNGNTVVLVVHPGVGEGQEVALLDVEAVGVVGGRVAVTLAVGGVTGGVVEDQAGDGQVLGVLDLEAVDGPVQDVEVLDLGVVHVLDDNEVVGPGRSYE